MTHHVLAFGDSLTAGYGLRSNESFAAQLQDLLCETSPGTVVHNAGLSGDTTGGGRTRLPRVLMRLTRKPDLALLELGANDLLRVVDPERMRENLDAMLEMFRDARIPVLLAGMVAPPFLGGFAMRYNAIFPELAAKYGVPLYPFFLDGVMGDPSLTLADRIHPNARAIGIIARRILPHVQAALDEGARDAA